MDLLSPKEKLRAAVFWEVSRICNDIGSKVNANYDKNTLRLIAELTWKRLQTWAEDLEHFAKHAQRSTITAEDVKLLVRRHPILKANITKMIEANKTATKEGKKRNSKDAEKDKNQLFTGVILPGTSSNNEELDVIDIDDDFL